MTTIVNARAVLTDRILEGATLVLEGDRLADVRAGGAPAGDVVDLAGALVVPGFVDVHVHGVEGEDVLHGDDAVRSVARRLARHGVAAFCPTTVACPPPDLRRVLDQIRAARAAPEPGAARVLPAHLESNFINPDYKGAQPGACLRLPDAHRLPGVEGGAAFSGRDILDEIDNGRAEVGIVTLAVERDGVLDLARALASRGHLVSLGHSGATYEQAVAGIEAGARHATHLFNRMSPLSHRAPGVVGAVLDSPAITAEIVCDGYHVHPAVLRTAIAVLGRDRAMAITDGTAAAGMPVGTRVALGPHVINVGAEAAFLDDGTLAGSTLTMDGAFRNLVRLGGLSEVDAAYLCATTPARQLGLTDGGHIAAGLRADLVALDGDLRVTAAWVGGVRVR